MNKAIVQMKASSIMLRSYLLWISGLVLVSFLVNYITGSFVDNSENTQVSAGNELSIFIIFMAIVIPLGSFRRLMNLGATRIEYYRGAICYYVIWAAIMAVVNVIWLQIELHYLRPVYRTFNILEIFHWDQFNYLGSFLYQFAVYMTLISLLNLLFSSLRHYIGWIIWMVLIAAIPISTSIAELRNYLAAGLENLLMNDSLAQGLAWNMGLVIVFILGGLWFTSKREF
jgi:hypothetical protein